MDSSQGGKESKGPEGGVSLSDSGRWTPEEAEVYGELRSTLKRRFQHLVEGVPHQGETRLFHEIYTELYITEGERRGGWVNDEHEVRQIERASWRPAAGGRAIKCSDIFKLLSKQKVISSERQYWRKGLGGPFRTRDVSEDDSDESDHTSHPLAEEEWDPFASSPMTSEPFHRGHKPRLVLTKGVAGIGKTVSVQKLILDWAEGQANQDVHFIFPLPFRELNLMRGKKLCLVDLLQHFFPEIKDSRIFNSLEHKVLIIFDGLDECRLPLDFQSNPKCSNVTEPASVDVLLTNLIKGNLLPSALLWITTRPAAANQIPPQCVNRVTEIRGFNDLQKEEYFRKKISDENLASRTITHLKSSRSLYIMCHIPVFCWITATVVERTSVESEKLEMPRTLSQMYTHFLIIQSSIKKEKYTERKETDGEVIFKLGKLAFQQLEKGNLIFYEEDLRECGIDVTEASVYSGVCTQIFREESGLYQGKVFSFVHLSIQEFLAALYVFLCFSNRERNMPDQGQTSQLSALFRAATLDDLHKTAVDLSLQSKNGHLDLFLRFLLGLSLESNQNLLRHLLPENNSQSQTSEQTVQYIKQKIRDQSYSDRRINLFYCLNEMNHHAVVEDIDRSSGTLYVDMLLSGQWKTRRFEFKIPEEQLDEFDLQKYIKTPEKDQTELISPDAVLQRLVPVVTSALLVDCSLTEKSCAALASAGRSNYCSLKELDLSDNELHDAGVQHLSDLLKNPHCKLEKLELRHCSLTEKSCAALASAGRSNSCSLKELNLSGNVLHDAGVQHLSDLLKNPHCKLEKLVLMDCSLTEKSCAALASAGRSNSCSLKELDLSYNELHDAGVQHLTDLLKNPHCKLEKLVLILCSLTEKSCAALASAGRSNSCSLKELYLSGNKLHDAGVQHLSDLLKNPHCKLEKLELGDGCILYKESPAAAAAAAAAAASTSSSQSSDAAELQLTHNTQQDPGAQLLSVDTHMEDHPSASSQRSCKSCADIPDSSHWVVVKPEVSTEKSISTYSLSSPAGSYECSESGLRWSCAAPVTLQYCFTDWHVFVEELAHMQMSPAGPLMDIRLMSGVLEQIHLPHFLCLGDSKASLCDAVRVLHGQDSGVCVEECELTRQHARLLHPSFSLLGPVYYLIDLLSPKVHCELLLFCTSSAPLELHAYLVPNDQGHIQAIHQKELKKKDKRGVWIDKPSAIGPLLKKDSFHVRTSCPSEINPKKINLWPPSIGNFCEVYVEQPEEGFDIEVMSSQHTEPIWTAKIRRRDYWQPSRSPGQGSSQRATGPNPNTDAAAFVDKHRVELIQQVTSVMPIADVLASKGLLNSEKFSEIEAVATNQGKMREIYKCLNSAGAQGKAVFYDALKQEEPYLVENLTENPD